MRTLNIFRSLFFLHIKVDKLMADIDTLNEAIAKLQADQALFLTAVAALTATLVEEIQGLEIQLGGVTNPPNLTGAITAVQALDAAITAAQAALPADPGAPAAPAAPAASAS